MSKRPGGIEYIAFSLPAADAEELRRLARRLAYVNVEPLAVELFRIGFQAIDQRFEPATRLAKFVRARRAVQGGRRGRQAVGESSDRHAQDARARERRSDRLSRRERRAAFDEAPLVAGVVPRDVQQDPPGRSGSRRAAAKTKRATARPTD